VKPSRLERRPLRRHCPLGRKQQALDAARADSSALIIFREIALAAKKAPMAAIVAAEARVAESGVISLGREVAVSAMRPVVIELRAAKVA